MCIIGLAVNVRFQTLFFAAGPGLVLLFQRRWKPMLVYGLGVFLPLAVIQSGIDLFLWGRPFAELTEYVMYNMANTTTYFDQPWYNYLLLLLGIFIPFLGVGVMFGFFQRRGPLLIWVPVLLFLAIHSYFPNKQERFILPIVPLFFVLGYTAWELWRERSAWWQAHPKLWRGQLIFAWTLNTVLLIVLIFSYSKRSRVEAMVGLRDLQGIRALIVEDTVEGEAPMPPLFYLGQWDVLVEPWTDPSTDMAARLRLHPISDRPDVILFFGVEDLPARVARAETVMGPLEILFEAKPGALDRAVHWLNPVNRNETIVVARTKATAESFIDRA